jgi:hypothetical protein
MMAPTVRFAKSWRQCYGPFGIRGGRFVLFETEEGGGPIAQKHVGGRSDRRQLQGLRIGIVGGGKLLIGHFVREG